MRLSRESRYAVTALALLAERPAGEVVDAGAMAVGAELPLPFLSKILRTLVRAGILVSFRGRGYALTRPAAEITLRAVLTAIEGEDPFEDKCLFWREECSAAEPCPLHWRWMELRPLFETELGGVTLDEIRARGLLRTPEDAS